MSSRVPRSVAAAALIVVASTSIPQLALAEDAAAAKEEDPYNKHFLGNAVPRRNVPPPKTGCIALGKIYTPIDPSDSPTQFHPANSWDWCQHACQNSPVSEMDGSVHMCTSFAFFPDGKCYLQGQNTKLVVSDRCTEAEPCDYGFPVISGPPSCDDKSKWAEPPADLPETTSVTEKPGPTMVGEGEECTTGVGPEYAVLCEDGLYCHTGGMLGGKGTCTAGTPPPAPTALPVVPVVPEAPAETTGAPAAVVPVPPVVAPAETTAAPETTPEPVAVTEVVTTPPEPTTTEEPLPEGLVVGYHYSPNEMAGTAKMVAADWKACMALCAGNLFCDHFSFYPSDNGCTLQGSGVTLMKTECADGTADCPEVKVITGPRDLTDKKQWPNLSKVGVAPTTPEPEMVKSGAKGVVVAPPAEKTESGGMNLALLAGIALCVMAFAAVIFFGYSQGWFSGEDAEEEDSDIEGADGLGKPLAAE